MVDDASILILVRVLIMVVGDEGHLLIMLIEHVEVLDLGYQPLGTSDFHFFLWRRTLLCSSIGLESGVQHRRLGLAG